MKYKPARHLPHISWHRIDITARWLFPFALLLFGLFVIGMPFGLPNQAVLRPVYAMACVYFWSLYRPSSLPAPLVALSGLVLDLLGYSPFGVWAVLLLILQSVALNWRPRLVGAPFIQVWARFTVLAVAVSILSWLINSAFDLTWLPTTPLFIECLWVVGLYPALTAMLVRAHRGPAALELV